MSRKPARAYIASLTAFVLLASQAFPLTLLAEETASTTPETVEVTPTETSTSSDETVMTGDDSGNLTEDETNQSTPTNDQTEAESTENRETDQTETIGMESATTTTDSETVIDILEATSTAGFVDRAPGTPTPLLIPDSNIGTSSTPGNIGTGISTSSPIETATSTSSEESTTSTMATVATSSETVSPEADQGAPTILSGTAVAMANIINILNTSFLNSIGSVIFSNFSIEAGTIDLRDVSPDGCSSACSGATWNILRNAYVKNDIAIEANSGGNTVEGNGGGITTGDAYAGLNLVNLVNSIFSDSRYLLATINAFGGVKGDIVFPSLDSFLNTSTGQAGGIFDSFAYISTTATTTAESGGNSADGDGSVLRTGAAEAYTNVYNQVNSILPGNGVSILMRVSGNWSGSLTDAPEGLKLLRGPDGSSYLFGILGESSGSDSQSSPDTIFGTSTAVIENTVSANANSGKNTTTGTASLISTGNAYAGVNVVNIANQHIVGKNWLLAIINIFGDFDGDIAFGRPDLWVGDTVSAPSYVENGSTLSYRITVINNGDANARGVILTERPDQNHVVFATSSIPCEVADDGLLTFRLGDIPKGKAVEVTYEATISNAPPGIAIQNRSTVTLDGTDNNLDDNTDGTTVMTSVPTGGGASTYIPLYPLSSANFSSTDSNSSASKGTGEFPIIKISRDTSVSTLSYLNASTTQQIAIWNESGVAAKGIVLYDTVKDPDGNIIHQEYYELGDIRADEEVEVSYILAFAENAPTGRYTLETRVEGVNIASRTLPNGHIDFFGKPTAPTTILLSEILPALHLPVNTNSRQSSSTTATSSIASSIRQKPNLSLPAAAAASAVDSNISAEIAALVILLVYATYVARTSIPRLVMKLK